MSTGWRLAGMAPAMFAVIVICDALVFVSGTAVGRWPPVVLQGRDGQMLMERPDRDEEASTEPPDAEASSTEGPNVRGWLFERVGTEGYVPPWYWLRRRSAEKRSLDDKGFFPTRRHISLFG
ncbi:uncharacterized protein LOC144870119 [Branchiostoma floridae x Branchiostoma japonicum]